MKKGCFLQQSSRTWRRVNFVTDELEWSYVEAGIRIRYSHVTHVPADTVAVLVWAKLYHKKRDNDDFYSTQKVFAIADDRISDRHVDMGRANVSLDSLPQSPSGAEPSR